MPKVHMLIGIPGSGKSTYAQKLKEETKIPIVSSDEIRKKFPLLDESGIWPKVYELAASYLNQGISIIYDATNITPLVRKRFDENLAKYAVSYEKIAYYFDTPPYVCVERVTKRNQKDRELFLPIEVIYSYAEKIIRPTLAEGFEKIIVIEK